QCDSGRNYQAAGRSRHDPFKFLPWFCQTATVESTVRVLEWVFTYREAHKTTMASVEAWVDDVARTTRPQNVVWCDGSDTENDRLIDQMVSDGTLIRLNQERLPNCFLHRSNPQDVARTEHLTFICSEDPEDAGPPNNWLRAGDVNEGSWRLSKNSMQRRRVYGCRQ